MIRLRASLLVLSALLALALPLSAQPAGFVRDDAGIIGEKAEKQLNELLRELEQKTGAELAVMTVQTTGGKDIFQFAQEQFDSWGFGKKGKDNGALFVIAVGDRKVRLHTGYGLEGTLPDSFCGTMLDNHVVPNFKAGRFEAGVLEGTRAIAEKIAGEHYVTLSGDVGRPAEPDYTHVPVGLTTQGWLKFGIILLAFIVVFAIIIFVARGGGMTGGGRYSRTFMGGSWTTFSGGSRGSSGGGFSGGFGGFGGGRTGGGGASRSW
jgi:uncharacterized protein